MLRTGICQMYSLLDGYLVLNNQCQYVHQGGRVQDLFLSHVNLIQSGMNTIQFRMDNVAFFLVCKYLKVRTNQKKEGKINTMNMKILGS